MEEDLILLKESHSDLNWFQKNIEEIRKDFEGELVAIKDKKVISFAPKIDLLIKKLKECNVDYTKVKVKYISPEGQIVIF